MFADSSALVAILLGEPEMPSLRAKLKSARRFTSSMVIYETTLAVARDSKKTLSEAELTVTNLLKAFRIQVVPIDARHATVALDAFERFGKGRHKAALNMGDCFSYACAQIQNVPLLFKGNDFIHVDDIKLA